MIDKAAKNDLTPEEDEVLDTIFTIPNLISTIRLCMVPCFIVLLLTGYDILATVLFAVAAGTDWIDGQIARRTHTVSKLGRLLDPAVDRILMISGVVCLLAVGRLPLLGRRLGPWPRSAAPYRRGVSAQEVAHSRCGNLSWQGGDNVFVRRICSAPS